MNKLFFVIAAMLLYNPLTFCQTNQKDSPVLKGPYLGQKPPGMTPEIFAPVSLQANETWFWHGSPSFSPSGNEIFFVKYIKGKNVTEIFRMKMKGQTWGAPENAFFSKAEYRDNNPVFLGPETLLFYSNRFGGSICRIEKIDDPGSQPVALAFAVPAGKTLGKQFSVTQGGSIFVELWNNDDSDADIYCCKPVDGKYEVCERLSADINSTAYDFNPYVDPEEKILVFASQRPGGFGKTDLYVSFRNADGTWTRAVNLGPRFNSAVEESFPTITPDGKYFIFCREGELGFNPYWVSVKISEELKLKE